MLTKDNSILLDVYATETTDDIVQKTQFISQQAYDGLVVAGGDGTLFYVLNGLATNTSLPIAVLPLGTGNDLSNMLGIRTVSDTVNAIRESNLRAVDILECEYTDQSDQPRTARFCSTAGIGVFANLFRQEHMPFAQRLRKYTGNLNNYLYIIPAFLNTCAVKCTLMVNQKQQTIHVKLLEISKVCQSGGLTFTPRAKLDSGLFDMWMVNDISLLSLVRIALKAIFQRHLNDTNVFYVSDTDDHNPYGLSKLDTLDLEIAGKAPFHIHGEFLGHNPSRIKFSGEKMYFYSNKVPPD